MVRQVYVKDNFLVKRSYKQINEFGGIEALYYILADGSVIFVRSGFKGVPTYHFVGDLGGGVGRFGGFCPNGDGGILIGDQVNGNKEWEFECIECKYLKVYSDNIVDEIVHNAICDVENEDLYL